jgi:hypothetical protein
VSDIQNKISLGNLRDDIYNAHVAITNLEKTFMFLENESDTIDASLDLKKKLDRQHKLVGKLYQQIEELKTKNTMLNNIINGRKEDYKRIKQIVLWSIIVENCPPHGGYKDGLSVEDCCESLSEAIEEYTKKERNDNYITLKELLEPLGLLDEETIKLCCDEGDET